VEVVVVFVVVAIKANTTAAAATTDDDDAIFLIKIEVDWGGGVFLSVFVAAADVTTIDDNHDDPATYDQIHMEIHDVSW